MTSNLRRRRTGARRRAALKDDSAEDCQPSSSTSFFSNQEKEVARKTTAWGGTEGPCGRRRPLCSSTSFFSNQKKEVARKKDWCGWSDSNRHGLRHYPLKIACLPVPPHPHRTGIVGCRESISSPARCPAASSRRSRPRSARPAGLTLPRPVPVPAHWSRSRQWPRAPVPLLWQPAR